MGADVAGYVEPFAGSLAILLARPGGPLGCETVNDYDGFIANFWRAVAADPEAVAREASWPVNEVDLSARHLWLVGQRAALTERLQVDPTYYDTRVAGWWLWGACAWIGSGWCSGEGPWTSDGERWIDRRKLPHLGSEGMGIKRKLPHLGNEGMGIKRKLPHLGNEGMGIKRQLPHLGDEGRGINRQLPHLGDEGRGEQVRAWMRDLRDRLRGVRVACGDWSRVVTGSVLRAGGYPCAVLLDPPYPEGAMAYSAGTAHAEVWHAARQWAIDNGGDSRLRIVFCGYEGGDAFPSEWRRATWKTKGGYSSAGGENDNQHREVLWLSPGCLAVDRTTGRQLSLGVK